MPKTIFTTICLVALLVAGTVTGPVATADTTAATTAAADLDEVIDATIDDLQAWWAEQLPEVYGQEYEPIPDERLHPYTSDDPPPACDPRGSGTTPYEEVAGNAFYCSIGDFVAWDMEELFPRLQARHGAYAVALVLAHEWGHAVQARVEPRLRATVYLEMQADCFAGSWADHVEDDHVDLGIANLDRDIALAGFLEFRDPPGIDPSNPGAHGNGFDRVSAFQDGFESGTGRCASYESEPPDVTESPYLSYEDALNEGDLPLDETVELLAPDLDHYWSTVLDGESPVSDLVADDDASCEGESDGGVLVEGVQYCSANDAVVYDPDTLEEIYDATGDFGAGMALAAAWASAALDELGEPFSGAAAHRIADCLTGAWTGDVARGVRDRGDEGISLSPGDLDQGIATFIALGDGGGDAFERVARFREGFFGGFDACDV